MTSMNKQQRRRQSHHHHGRSAITLLLSLSTIIQPIASQTWEQSNDPDNLCSSNSNGKITGYKSTLDCRGYVYCNDGYLMGGGAAGESPSGVSGGSGVIACWPNQLFDESAGVCNSWQSVDTSRCPQFDGSKMMPELTDGNANEKRFFCGVSASNAKRVCEACPGGSRLECSDPTHNCFAGITGCTSAVPQSQSTTNNNIIPPPTPSSRPPSKFPTPLPSKLPTKRPVADVAPVAPNNNINNGNNNPASASMVDLAKDDDVYLHGKLRSSYYCGWSWALAIKTCNMSPPCPSGLNTECPTGQTCFPDTPCASLQTPPPTSKATPRPVTQEEKTYYCGYDWDWVVNNCARTTPCPYGDAMGVCPSGMKCIADTPCWAVNNGMPTPKPTPLPTKLSFPPVKGDDPTKRYCGYDWGDVTKNCLIAVPCPSGYAQGVCPNGMNCIAETQCADETYLDWLRDKQANNGSGQAFVESKPSQSIAASAPSPPTATAPSPPTTTATANNSNNNNNSNQCSSNRDCQTGQFCNQPDPGLGGYCGECLSDGTGYGCSTEEVCRTSGCHDSEGEPGVAKCYTAPELDQDCEIRLNDIFAKCNVDKMVCVSQKQQTTTPQQEDVAAAAAAPVNTGSGSGVGATALFPNPEGNNFFCGAMFAEIAENCLQSKPCPGGFASNFCAEHEGCFSVPNCAVEYESATIASGPPPSPPTPNPSKQPTSRPTPNPTPNPSEQPTNPPTRNPTMMPTPSDPVASTIISNSSPSSKPTQQPTLPPSSKLAEQPELAKNEPVASVISPSKAPITSSPSKAPMINTNFCGISWKGHTKDCANSLPCPKGDECASSESCFTGSPCAILNSPDDANFESNVGSFCGTEWNVLMSTCESTTKCPNGNECAEGEFCYRDFVCNPPPPTTTTTSTTTATTTSTMTLTTVATALSGTNDSSSTERNPATSQGSIGSSTLNIGGETNQNPPTTGQTAPQIQPEPSESCSLCGNSELDWSERVNFDGDDISCGEFGWIFLSENILEGSDRCLNFRAQYFDKCCYAKPSGVGCDLCDTEIDGPWHDIQENINVEFDGDDISCADLSNKIRTRFEPSSAQCTDIKNTHFESCCFQRCSLCGDSNLDWEATVYFSGEEVLCHELDSKIFVEEGISSDSSRCEMSQNFYAGTCCIQAPEQPCNLCSSNGIHFNMNSNTRVSYDGEVKTCLEVYHSLYSRRDQSNEHCTAAQGELFDQCCEAISSQTIPDGGIGERASPSPTKSPTTNKPTPNFDSWYTAGSLSSPASTFMDSIGSFSLLMAVGLMVIIC